VQSVQLLFILLFLSSCVSTPELSRGKVVSDKITTTGGWSLKGRVGLKMPQKSGSFNINWAQQGDGFEIYITSTLGLSIAHLKGSGRGDSRRASIDIPKRGHFEAASAALLLKDHTGLVIPIESLQYWVRGEPAPESIFEKKKDFKNQEGFEQQKDILIQSGWVIEYLAYEDELPVRIKLARGEVSVMLIIKEWKDIKVRKDAKAWEGTT